MFKSNTPPPRSMAYSYIAPLVRVLVLTAFLVAAVQTSVLAGYDYCISVHNNTGQDWQYLSVIVNDGASADFASVRAGEYVNVNHYEYITYVSVVYTLYNGTTITQDNLPIYGAEVYVR